MANKPLVYLLEIDGQLLPTREVRGHEAMSETSRYEVELFLPDGVEIDPDAVVKTEARLVMTRAETVRTITAVVSEVEVTASVEGRPSLRVVLEPRFALARYRTNIKVFRDKRVPEIVAEVLGELGVAFEQRLLASYPVRPYCVQYRETDLHFVSRMLEEEGIFYFFGPGDVMVMGDHTGAYDGLGAVPFYDSSGMDRNHDAVETIGEKGIAGPSKITLRDWCADRPSANMDVESAGPTPAGPEYYDFPGEYEEPAAGQRIADLTAESYRCAAEGVTGHSYVGAFAVGSTFDLVNRPPGLRESSFVLTRVEHAWQREAEGFAVDFDGLSAQKIFRPRRIHEEADVTNPVTGIVTGPGGEDIHTDSAGRVKVHFHWDRLQPYDDTCSHWVPVLQDNTGQSVAHPRIGWEVLVHFLEGDPDRPVVLGRVYNAEDQFPALLPRDKTHTSLKSMTSPGRDGTNEIRFEDLAGEEHILVHAQKDQHVVVSNDQDEKILQSETVRTGHDETIEIGADHQAVIGDKSVPTVMNDRTVAIGGNRTRKVAGGDGTRVVGNHSLTVGGMSFRRIGTADGVTSHKLQERIGGVDLELSLKHNAMNAGAAYALTVGGAIIEIAREDKTESASKGRAETIGGLLFTKAGAELKTQVDKNRITTVGGLLRVKSQALMTLSGKEKFLAKSATAEQTASQALTVKVGESVLTMKDGLMKVLTSGKIAMKVKGANEQGSEKAVQNP